MEEAAPPTGGDGIASATGQWCEAADWAGRAGRLGPLRFSDLGRRWIPPPPPDRGLSGWLADAADRWWEAAGRPDPYVVAVVSADDGTLARDVLGSGPACLDALRYIMVDPEADTVVGRARQRCAAGLVGLEEPAFLLPTRRPAPVDPADPGFDYGDDPDEPPPLAQGVGPLVTRLSDLPVVSELAGPGTGGPTGLVVAIEVLSRLPYDLFELDATGGWSEVRLAAGGVEGDLYETVVPLDPERVKALLDSFAQMVRPGRHARQDAAAGWLRRVLGATVPGVIAVAVVDRWSDDGTAPPPSIAYDQMRHVREPAEGPPAALGSALSGLSVVTWRP